MYSSTPFSSEHFLIQPFTPTARYGLTRLCHILLDVAENYINPPNTPNPNLPVVRKRQRRPAEGEGREQRSKSDLSNALLGSRDRSWPAAELLSEHMFRSVPLRQPQQNSL